MTDTSDIIDMLEAIGQDATLRYASNGALTRALTQVHASEGLTAAVALGDSARLFDELGCGKNEAPQIVQAPGHEEPEEEEKPEETPASSRHAL